MAQQGIFDGGSLTLYLAAALFLAALVRGFSGFGFSAIFIILAALVTNPLPLIPIVFACEIAMTAFQARGIAPHIDWKRVGALLLGSAVAIWPAVALMASLDPNLARLVISAMVLGLCALLLSGWQVRREMGRPSHFAAGLVAGIANSAGVGGLPTAGFLSAQSISPAVFRATMIIYLTGLDLMSLPVMAGHGLVGADTLLGVACAFPILGLGVWVGSRGFARIDAQSFRRSILILLAALACLNILRVL